MAHIYFSIPYALDKRLFNAYDYEFRKLENSDDWLAIMDGDAFFFQSDFGHIIDTHIQQHPDTGLFTAYTNRIGNDIQLLSDKAKKIDSIRYHFQIAKQLRQKNTGKSTVQQKRVAGFLMIIKKATWDALRPTISGKCKSNKIFGVDYMIADAMRENNYTIRLMEDLYVFHYRRMDESGKERGLE